MKPVLSAVAICLVAGCSLTLTAQETTTTPNTPSTQTSPTTETPDTQAAPAESPSTQTPDTQTPDTMEPAKSAQPQSAQAFSGKVVKIGDKLMLKDSATQTSYQLDDQDKAQPYVGKDVKVLATLDANSNTLHVVDIGPAESQ